MTTTGDDGWRQALDRYLGTAASAEVPQVPVGLRFELREFLPRNGYRWNGPLSRVVRMIPAAGLNREHRLAVRPVAKTAGGWARGTITWSNLPHLQNRLHLRADHHRWCCELGALYRAIGPTDLSRDPEWVFLDDFANPALWAMLDQTGDLGVPLLGPRAGGSVHRADQADVTLDVSRTDDTARLQPRLVIDGQAVPAHDAHPIGAHGVYRVDRSGSITIAPTPAPLTTEQAAMLGVRREPPVVIPAAEIDDFMAEYLPALRERIQLSSADGSVSLPAPLPPELVATVTHLPGQALSISWRWDDRQTGPRRALADLLAPGLLPADWIDPDASLPNPVTLSGVEAAEFTLRVLPRLSRLDGIRVETSGTAPNYRELRGAPELDISVVPAEKHDWFSLGITVTIDGVTIPFTPLFTALAKGRRKLLLIDGSYLSLNHPALRELAALVEEAAHQVEWEPVPSLSRHQLVTSWPAFEDLADQEPPATQWRALVAEAAAESPRPVPTPAGLAATLRPYQAAGLSWLAFLWRSRLGGILADDMGLGKTLQCLAMIAHAREHSPDRRPFLVVAPTSVVPNWVSEAGRFTPGLAIRQIAATEAAGRTPLTDAVADYDIVVTSYALLRLDFEAYQRVAEQTGWAGLILDEAQFVKNPAARIFACAAELPVDFKLALTGTPVENSLTDLQALFAVVAPGLFPSAPKFQRDYVRPIEQPLTGIAAGVGAGSAPEVAAQVRAERLEQLRRRIRPFLLRRTKEHVAAELPPRQEQVLRVDLGPQHREIYDLYLQRERRKVLRLLDEDEKNNKFIVFRSLTLLRLLALDAGLVAPEYESLPSAKLTVLMEQLADVVAEGHRALVFSQFTSYLSKVAARLDTEGIAHAYLDGSTRGRRAVIDDFRAGTAPVFLISLKAGGFGVNLTEADYVFLLDPWWNPASERQAIDRTHRIGQTRNVLVYRLVAADTIEEKVMALQRRKATLFDALFRPDEQGGPDGEFGRGLSARDLRELLS